MAVTHRLFATEAPWYSTAQMTGGAVEASTDSSATTPQKSTSAVSTSGHMAPSHRMAQRIVSLCGAVFAREVPHDPTLHWFRSDAHTEYERLQRCGVSVKTPFCR